MKYKIIYSLSFVDENLPLKKHKIQVFHEKTEISTLVFLQSRPARLKRIFKKFFGTPVHRKHSHAGRLEEEIAFSTIFSQKIVDFLRELKGQINSKHVTAFSCKSLTYEEIFELTEKEPANA